MTYLQLDTASLNAALEAFGRHVKDNGWESEPLPYAIAAYLAAASLPMSLRDSIASQALAAIIQADGIQYAGNSKSWASHAAMAYAHADAMLVERAKDSKP